MESSKSESADKVAILSENLLHEIIHQLEVTQEEMTYMAGDYPGEDTSYALENGVRLLTSLKAEVVITPDPWEALASAEQVLSDWETAKRKGYIADAKKRVFTLMDAKRFGK